MHTHHIIPKHEWKKRFGNLKGVNDRDNIIVLTVEQHAEVHKLLYEQNNNWEDEVAWRMLSGQINSQEATLLSIKKTQKGRIHTKEHIEKIAKTKRGKTYEQIMGTIKAEELKKIRSKQSKINWKNEQFKEKISKKASESWNDLELRKRMSLKPKNTKNYSSAAYLRHSDPEYKERHRLAIIKSWQKRKIGDLR